LVLVRSSSVLVLLGQDHPHQAQQHGGVAEDTNPKAALLLAPRKAG
jgi:hypothetical protein